MTEEERGLIQINIFAELNLPYVFKPENPEKFKKLLYDVIRYYNEREVLDIKARVLELLGMILSQFDLSPEKVQTGVVDTVTTVKSYIDNNFMQILTLDALALQFHTNKFTLVRKFKASYGCGVMEYYKKSGWSMQRKHLPIPAFRCQTSENSCALTIFILSADFLRFLPEFPLRNTKKE